MAGPAAAATGTREMRETGRMPTVNEFGHECWIVETSKDGEKWRYFGKAWKEPGEPMLMHGVPRFLRFRPDDEKEWRAPLERHGDHPMTLLRFDESERTELWPTEEHVGIPMLLPGGEIGRLMRFEHHETEPDTWTFALEFRGTKS